MQLQKEKKNGVRSANIVIMFLAETLINYVCLPEKINRKKAKKY